MNVIQPTAKMAANAQIHLVGLYAFAPKDLLVIGVKENAQLLRMLYSSWIEVEVLKLILNYK